MAMTDFGLRFNRILRDFEEGYTTDAKKIENEFLARLGALKDRVKELKSQPKAKRTVRSRVKQFEENEENKAAALEENDAPTGGRTKRKAALKARQVSEALTTTTRSQKGTKRKSSQSPVNERVKAVRQEDVAEVVKPITRRTRGRPRKNVKQEESVEIEKSVVKSVECTVVLQKVQTVTVHNKLEVVSAEVESSTVKSKISKFNSPSEANRTKTLFKFPPSKQIDEVPSTSKANPREPDTESGNSEKDSGSNQSSCDKTVTPKNKRSSSRVEAKDIPKPSPQNQEKDMGAESNSDSELMSPEKKVPKMAEPSVQSLSTEKDTSVGISIKASPVKKLTKSNMVLPKEDKLTPIGSPAEDSDESTLTEAVTGQKRTRSKMAPPKGKAVSPARSPEEDSQSTLTESVTGQKRTRSKNVPVKGKEVPPTRSPEEGDSEASSSEASPENDVKKPKTPPLKDEDKSRKIASGMDNEDTPVLTKNDTSEKRKTRSKKAAPKENKDALIRSESEKDISEATVKHPTPEKRITRSKLAPPKVNNNNQRLAAEDESDSKKATPEKRVTRSKAAKPKEKKIEIVSGSSDEDTPQQKAKPPIELPMSGVKVKELAGFFSPAVNSRNNLLEKELKTAEKRQVTKATPLQVRNAFIVTPSSNSKSKFSAGFFSASKSKTAFDELERRRKEEEARLKMLKEEEALRKKRELMKAKQEEIRRKNEEKMQKAAAARRAVDKETNQRLVKMEKEKEERDRLAREQLEKKKEEEANRKKIFNEMKAQEAEIRRQREEAARIAKLKEAEEEKRREEELRQRQQEEMERLKKQRMEEMRMKEAALKAREMQKKKANVIPLKDKDNYDISDVAAGDDSDEDESNPKKELPLWARKGEEKDRQERIQSLVSIEVAAKYFACPSQSPDLTDFFGKMTMKRVRTSSAVWLHTPPLSRIQE